MFLKLASDDEFGVKFSINNELVFVLTHQLVSSDLLN